MEERRVYFVIDARSFYASVEAVDRGLDPLTCKLVVADAERTEKTICLAVSPALKAQGVKNRCRLFEVPKDPEIVIAKPRMKRYIEVAAGIYGLYLKKMAKEDMHVYSIDEVILDVTTYLKLYKVKAKDYAMSLMKEVKDTFGIPMTAGIGTNMYLAKVASGIMAKHDKDGIGWLDEERFMRLLSNTRPLSFFWQISHGIEAHLAKMGIFDMEGIRKCPEEYMYKEFGVNAELLIDHAYGREPTRMEHIKNYKSAANSLGTNQILPEPYEKKDGLEILLSMIETLALDLANKGLVSSRLYVGVMFEQDKKKRKPSVHFTVDIQGQGNLASLFTPIAEEQYLRRIPPGSLIRSIAVAFADVRDEPSVSYGLFDEPEKIEKESKLRDSLIEIEKMYGKNAVLRGADFTAKSTRRERNKMIGGHMGGEDE